MPRPGREEARVPARAFFARFWREQGPFQRFTLSALILFLLLQYVWAPADFGMQGWPAVIAGVIMDAAVLTLLWGLGGMRWVQRWVMKGKKRRRGR